MNPQTASQDSTSILSAYLKDISKINHCSRQEEAELGTQIANGSIEAANEIVRRNLKFIVHTAKSYAYSGVPMSELISEGNLAALNAARRFKGGCDVKFITYAAPWIKYAMSNYAKEYASRISLNDTSEPGESPSECHSLLNIRMVESRESERLDEQKAAISNLMECLQDRERNIIQMFFGLNGQKERTLAEIGNDLGITQERVRQLKERALGKMKTSAMLLDYEIRSEYQDLRSVAADA